MQQRLSSKIRFHASLTVCLMLAGAAAAEAQDPVGTEAQGFHGMLVVGSEAIYMSHLPMFTPQHRYQGLWEVSFGEAEDETYREARARPQNAGRIFTLAPRELFRLPELASTETPRSS